MLPGGLRLILCVLAATSATFGGSKGQPLTRATAVPPQPLSWVPPAFPQEVAGQKVKGWVRLSFIVNETGEVISARVVKSSDRVFENAARESVLKWRFVPGVVGGKNASWGMDVTVPFAESDMARWAKNTALPKKVSGSLSAPPRTRSVKVSGNDPDYPDSLLPRKLSGEVGAVLFIDASGRVEDVKIAAATHSDFIIPALAVVKRWISGLRGRATWPSRTGTRHCCNSRTLAA